MKRDLKKIIAKMTLEEKAGLCSGADFWHTKAVERLGIPAVMMSDGPHGLRKQAGEGDHLGLGESIPAVCFPAACATASGFDTELMEELGKTLGEECQAEGVDILLGPAVNIKRSPLCGRNFEYLSEDPYLTGKLAAAYIKGVQSCGVGTSIKHFAGNNQEYNRMSCSSEMSERTLREIYLPGFEEAVKASQPKTVMCSYNKINGVYSAENKHLLSKILRDEWGFEGFVMTDWGAVGDRVKGVEAGLELEMPSSGGIHDAKIVAAVQEGRLDEALLDQAVERILKAVFSCADSRNPKAVFDRDADHKKAVRMEEECAVLLENDGVLPLKAGQKAVYIGAFAQKPRYQGGGSSHINAGRVTSAWESAVQKGRSVSYVKGFPQDADTEDEAELQKAVEAAKAADVAVIFAGLPDLFESEGYDRTSMKLPVCQDKLIGAVAAVQPNTVVVLHNGSPVECPWAKAVAAVLELYLGGEGAGEACDRLLWGEANPAGRLAETFPLRLEDNPSYLNFPGDGKKVHYAEGVYVGYRYYDTKKQPVRWAFGHGLSYTSFAYSNLQLSAEKLDDDGALEVSVDVANTGAVAGKEVVQLYISDKNGTAGRPAKELKGFVKVCLEPGETKTVRLSLDARFLSFYHEELGDWYAPSGTYEVLLGHASDDIVLYREFSFETKKLLPMHVDMATTAGELLKDPRTAPVIGQMMQKAMADGAGHGEASADHGNAAEQEGAAAGHEGAAALGDPAEQAMKQAMMFAMPIKSMVSFGAMTEEQAEGLIALLNSRI